MLPLLPTSVDEEKVKKGKISLRKDSSSGGASPRQLAQKLTEPALNRRFSITNVSRIDDRQK